MKLRIRMVAKSLQMSALHPDEQVTSKDEALAMCAAEGARLWQPRNKDTRDTIKEFWVQSIGQANLPESAVPRKFFIGIDLDLDPAGKLVQFFPDGVRVPEETYSFYEWNEPPTDNARRCVAMTGNQFVPVNCAGT